MRVVAFSCAHWMSEAVQRDIYEYEPLNYKPFIWLCRHIMDNPPDAVIDLGDTTEQFYETYPYPAEYVKLAEGHPHFFKLQGNHDRWAGGEFLEIDDVRYEHGHKLGRPCENRDDYIVEVRLATAGMKLVHGHTHEPNEPAEARFPLDVGSITFSGTYGEVIDGQVFRIRYAYS